ncbi:hypothetical protein CA982_03575 [Gordonia lacunae]|uniref:DUF7064 domain-containing protein n=1 Tax=Gordonia lacunae TaxID=417102 RepID=A0A243QFB5_9ACTN|nr:hypothetical protein CA982_03575 [Gordonia lacunae]
MPADGVAGGGRAFTEGRHVLDPARPRHRESIVWVIPRVADGVTAFVYTWVNSRGEAGAALSVFGDVLGEQIFEKVDGIAVPDSAGFDDYRVGPLSLSLADSGMSSTVQFAGDRVSMSVEFEGLHAPFRYGEHIDGCPGFFADDRLEQTGIARGVLRVDGRVLEFDEMCQRDHSWGERDWEAMHHMKWVNALNRSTAVHAVELLAYGQRYLRGYLYRAGRCVPVRDLELRYDLDSELLHTRMQATWTDEEGRVARVDFADGGPHFVWDVSANFTLRDTAMAARIDGDDAVAYVDMSWDPAYMTRTTAKTGSVSVSL